MKDKKLNRVMRIMQWADDHDFPVQGINDLSALAYVTRNFGFPDKAQELVEFQTKMLTYIQSEHDLSVKVNQ